MPDATDLELTPHDPFWLDIAEDEITQLKIALDGFIQTAHHIGSTAIPSLKAKPIIDILASVKDLNQIGGQAASFNGLGYEHCPTLSGKGRWSAFKLDPETNKHLFHIHCYQSDDPAIERHIAFRDFLRLHENIARKYQNVKTDCQLKYSSDGQAYNQCKGEWITKWEIEAVKFFN